ncbi:MAG: prepilin peptidase [Chloroflexi bacterium]|nr:prepilin peptidase [Chloroflexota bacterium]
MTGWPVLLLWLGLFGAIAACDLRWRRIPDWLLALGALVALGLAVERSQVLDSLLGGAGAFGSFWLLRAVGRRLPPAPLGWGDVKLAGLVGLVCGLPLTPLALLLGTAAGAGAALALLLAGWPRRAFFPYAPALASGALVALGWSVLAGGV